MKEDDDDEKKLVEFIYKLRTYIDRESETCARRQCNLSYLVDICRRSFLFLFLSVLLYFFYFPGFILLVCLSKPTKK